MKKFCLILVNIAMCAYMPVHSQVVVTHIHIDPLTASAVKSQTDMLKDLYSQRLQHQQQIIANEAVINATLNKIQNIEQKAFEYLTVSQDAIKGIYHIARVETLVTKNIPDDIGKLKKAISDNVGNMALSSLLYNTVVDLGTQMTSIAPLVQKLVLGGKEINPEFDDDGNRLNKEAPHLLTSAERYKTANEIVKRLERIDGTIQYLTFQVKQLNIRNMFSINLLSVERDIINSGRKVAAENVINRWKANAAIYK